MENCLAIDINLQLVLLLFHLESIQSSALLPCLKRDLQNFPQLALCSMPSSSRFYCCFNNYMAEMPILNVLEMENCLGLSLENKYLGVLYVVNYKILG